VTNRSIITSTPYAAIVIANRNDQFSYTPKQFCHALTFQILNGFPEQTSWLSGPSLRIYHVYDFHETLGSSTCFLSISISQCLPFY